MDLPITVKLNVPIVRGSETISELVIIRKPKAKDMRNISHPATMGDTLNVIGAIANQPPSVMDEIDLSDIGQLTELFNSFF